jgi:hypothetical protein
MAAVSPPVPLWCLIQVFLWFRSIWCGCPYGDFDMFRGCHKVSSDAYVGGAIKVFDIHCGYHCGFVIYCGYHCGFRYMCWGCPYDLIVLLWGRPKRFRYMWLLVGALWFQQLLWVLFIVGTIAVLICIVGTNVASMHV